MPTYLYGSAHAYGINPIRPMVGFPSGKKRVCMRAKEFVRVSVKTNDGFRHFRVRWDEEKNWVPGDQIGRTEISE